MTAPAESPPELTAPELTAVVVEDDPIDVEAIRRGARRLGLPWHMRVFADGVEALRGFRGQHAEGPVPRPFFILLDLSLPRMNGIELLEVLRADPTLADACVFVLTTSDDRRDVEASRALKVAGYFTKSSARRDYGETLASVGELYREYSATQE